MQIGPTSMQSCVLCRTNNTPPDWFEIAAVSPGRPVPTWFDCTVCISFCSKILFELKWPFEISADGCDSLAGGFPADAAAFSRRKEPGALSRGNGRGLPRFSVVCFRVDRWTTSR